MPDNKQMRLEDAVMKMGVIPNWTCTPYYGFTAPRMGRTPGLVRKLRSNLCKHCVRRKD